MKIALPFLALLFSVLFLTMGCEKDIQPYDLLNKRSTFSVLGGEARIHQAPTGDTWLSWIEDADSITSVLQFAQWDGVNWSKPQEISRGTDWFVNWADFPGVCNFGTSDQKLLAYWLQKSDEGTYDYDVRISITQDGGKEWSESQILHQDGIPAEHGFVSVSTGEDYLQMLWLDGRNTKAGGPMSIRTAKVYPDGTITDTLALDQRVCDCCQTTITNTRTGFVAAYRDRSEEEVRDISLVRFDGQSWSEPYQVHPDHWKIAGCPVNGPQLVSKGDTVALAWFTGAVEDGASYLSFSVDGGQTFGPKYQLSEGPNLGRLKLVMQPDASVLAMWVEPNEIVNELKMRAVGLDGELGGIEYVHLLSGGRNSGFPQAALVPEGLLVNFTIVPTTNDPRRMAALLFEKEER